MLWPLFSLLFGVSNIYVYLALKAAKESGVNVVDAICCCHYHHLVPERVELKQHFRHQSPAERGQRGVMREVLCRGWEGEGESERERERETGRERPRLRPGTTGAERENTHPVLTHGP
jgi:hypothetical protein